MPTDRDDAWSELHDAKPPGWFVGRPSYDERRKVWEQYAFDPQERARAGVRSREWTAVAATELEVIRELERYLRLIREGRVQEQAGAPGRPVRVTTRKRSQALGAEPGATRTCKGPRGHGPG